MNLNLGPKYLFRQKFRQTFEKNYSAREFFKVLYKSKSS